MLDAAAGVTLTTLTDRADQTEGHEKQATVNIEVLRSVVESYYPDAVRAGTTARLRAQAAQSVATAFAGVAVASLTLNNFKQLHLQVRAIGCIAVIAWAVAAILYMRAVGAPSPELDKLRGVGEPDKLVRVVLDRAKAERESIDRRQFWGNAVAVSALMLTIATFVATVFLPEYKEEKPVTFVPSADQVSLLSRNGCKVDNMVTGRLRVKSLGTDTLEFVIRCGEGNYLLVLPKSDVKGMVVDDS